MKPRVYLYLLIATVLTACASAEQGDRSMNLEQSVCGLKEPLLFWLWSRQAGSPDKNRLKGLSNVVDIKFRTADGRTLRGYQLAANLAGSEPKTSKPKGYLLVIQGNAILADQILAEFRSYAEAGYDVYIYDYRGYGRSEGRRRLKAIVNDYKAIIHSFNAGAYEQKFIYAMSLGGIVFLDAITDDLKLDRVVIDSSPGRLSTYGCPASYDPIEHLPVDCSNFMFIIGQRDRVVTPAMSQEMVEKAQLRGARLFTDPEYSHPFMDPSWSVHQRRMSTIEKFLLQGQ